MFDQHPPVPLYPYLDQPGEFDFLQFSPDKMESSPRSPRTITKRKRVLEGETDRELTVQARNQALNSSVGEASPMKFLSTRWVDHLNAITEHL